MRIGAWDAHCNVSMRFVLDAVRLFGVDSSTNLPFAVRLVGVESSIDEPVAIRLVGVDSSTNLASAFFCFLPYVLTTLVDRSP